jgi:DNA mismatch endonuclease (patch repair protein)
LRDTLHDLIESSRALMADIVSPAVRSRMMAGIRGTNTKPEITLRRGLFAKGFRYRLHARSLAGKPDIVFPKFGAVIFVHGCFWHGHDCSLFKWPKSNEGFWKTKIDRNRQNDHRTTLTLSADGWRQATVWECALRGKHRLGDEQVVKSCARWLKSKSSTLELRERT